MFVLHWTCSSQKPVLHWIMPCGHRSNLTLSAARALPNHMQILLLGLTTLTRSGSPLRLHSHRPTTKMFENEHCYYSTGKHFSSFLPRASSSPICRAVQIWYTFQHKWQKVRIPYTYGAIQMTLDSITLHWRAVWTWIVTSLHLSRLHFTKRPHSSMTKDVSVVPLLHPQSSYPILNNRTSSCTPRTEFTSSSHSNHYQRKLMTTTSNILRLSRYPPSRKYNLPLLRSWSPISDLHRNIWLL